MESKLEFPQSAILTPYNYFEWKPKIQLHLRSRGLFRITMETEVEPTSAVEKSRYFNRMDEAFGILCFAISPELLFHVESCSTPNEVWKILEELFGKQNEMLRMVEDSIAIYRNHHESFSSEPEDPHVASLYATNYVQGLQETDGGDPIQLEGTIRGTVYAPGCANVACTGNEPKKDNVAAMASSLAIGSGQAQAMNPALTSMGSLNSPLQTLNPPLNPGLSLALNPAVSNSLLGAAPPLHHSGPFPAFYDQHPQPPPQHSQPLYSQSRSDYEPVTRSFKGLSGPLPSDVAAELYNVLNNLTRKKESIKGVKTWFMQRSPFAPALAEALKEGTSCAAYTMDNNWKQCLVEKLSKLNSTRDSVEVTSRWCMFYRNRAHAIVETWGIEFENACEDSQISLLYLANDILLNSVERNGCESFVEEFWRVLPIYLKILHLRIYRRMFYDCSIDCKEIFCLCVVRISLNMLGRENVRDISNEELYNGMAVLKCAWMRNKKICVEEFDYVDVIGNVVNICVSRFQDMHAAAIASRAKPISACITASRHEEEKNINLISIALDRGLWLINSILTAATPHEGEGEFFADSKQKLQNSDTSGVIVRIVKLVLAGFKYMWSSHLQLGINIAATLIKEGVVPFDEEEGAAKTYDRAALKFGGRDAITNFSPTRDEDSKARFMRTEPEEQCQVYDVCGPEASCNDEAMKVLLRTSVDHVYGYLKWPYCRDPFIIASHSPKLRLRGGVGVHALAVD